MIARKYIKRSLGILLALSAVCAVTWDTKYPTYVNIAAPVIATVAVVAFVVLIVWLFDE